MIDDTYHNVGQQRQQVLGSSFEQHGGGDLTGGVVKSITQRQGQSGHAPQVGLTKTTSVWFWF